MANISFTHMQSVDALIFVNRQRRHFSASRPVVSTAIEIASRLIFFIEKTKNLCGFSARMAVKLIFDINAHWRIEAPIVNLSESDRVILRMLQANARERLETIAYEAGLSVATVQRRVRTLKDAGVILRDAAVISPAAMGYGMSFIILVELERERIDQIDAFRRKVKLEPQIQQCYYITGAADFALIALARDMDDFQLLTQRLFFEDTNVKRFTTSVVMDRTKISLDVPLPE